MSSQYLLDTNICIYIAKQQPPKVLKKFQTLKVGQVAMSVITYGELTYGACKSNAYKKTMRLLNELTELIPALDLPETAAQQYGAVRAELEAKGKIIGNNDLWIASHALSSNLILVTNNVKEFKRVPKLKVENWV